MHTMYLPPPRARVSRFAFETMPASPTNTQRLNCQPLSSSFTLATAVTSTVLPGKIQCRTGKPSRVTASPITICGTSLRPFLVCPCLRRAWEVLRPAATLPCTSPRSPSASAASTPKCSEVVSLDTNSASRLSRSASR